MPATSITDCFGQTVRLTEERLSHVLLHAEMAALQADIEGAVESPDEVRVSRTDSSVSLFYKFYSQTMMGPRWLCVVVKYGVPDPFVITAYLTDKMKAGETIWPIK